MLTENKKRKIKEIIGECEICKSKENLEIHRIKRGGDYALRNIKILCKKCHKKIHQNESRMR